VGTLILARPIGAKSCILVKEERGLLHEDRRRTARRLIPDISVAEILERDLGRPDIERPCLEILQKSEVIDRLQVVNGLERETSPRPGGRTCGDDILPKLAVGTLRQ
jgi:molybdenum storage protein